MAFSLEGHADHTYDGELNHIHLLMVEMGGLALDQSRLALAAFRHGDLRAASNVITREPRLDALELTADDSIISLISRHGPIGRDLRVTMAFSKVITDLERIGDEAVRIAQIALSIHNREEIHSGGSVFRDVDTMATGILKLLEEALDALDTLDATIAEALLNGNRERGSDFQSSLARLTAFAREDANNAEHAINLTLVIKALEGLSEHTEHLAEYVIYLVKGVDVRHRAQHRQG